MTTDRNNIFLSVGISAFSVLSPAPTSDLLDDAGCRKAASVRSFLHTEYTERDEMTTDKSNYLHKELTEKIISCFYEVYNTLGFGFLEKVYENAMLVVLAEKGLRAKAQQPIKVYFKDSIVGDYFADIVVEDTVIVELKAVEALAEEHEYQLINYLKATNVEVGLLLNFGKKPEIKRKIFTNDRKEKK